MKRLFYIPILLIGLGLPACGNNELAVIQACTTAATGLKIATGLKARGALSRNQIATIDAAVNTIDPICGAGTIPDPDVALDTLELQLLLMNGVIFPAGGA